jgi:hypothetical protein
LGAGWSDHGSDEKNHTHDSNRGDESPLYRWTASGRVMSMNSIFSSPIPQDFPIHDVLFHGKSPFIRMMMWYASGQTRLSP